MVFKPKFLSLIVLDVLSVLIHFKYILFDRPYWNWVRTKEQR